MAQSVGVVFGPMRPVFPSLVAPFEAFIGKPVAEMTEAEKLRAARAVVAASHGGQHADAVRMREAMA